MRSKLLHIVAAAWLAMLLAPTFAAAPDFEVKVQKTGDDFRSFATLFVRASPQRAWDVLTDYARAPEFTPNLEESRVIARSGDTLRLYQKRRVQWGPFSVPVETVREIRLIAPSRTESRLVSGSLDKYESTTEVLPEAGGTRIIYRSHAVPGASLAAFAGESLVKRETEEAFRHLRAEILKRQQVAGTSVTNATVRP
jgi:hypothetical protein